MSDRWFDIACQALDEALEMGDISYDEYRKSMNDLRDELRCKAMEDAERAYNDTMGIGY
jgi:hypothetical protein